MVESNGWRQSSHTLLRLGTPTATVYVASIDVTVSRISCGYYVTDNCLLQTGRGHLLLALRRCCRWRYGAPSLGERPNKCHDSVSTSRLCSGDALTWSPPKADRVWRSGSRTPGASYVHAVSRGEAPWHRHIPTARSPRGPARWGGIAPVFVRSGGRIPMERVREKSAGRARFRAPARAARWIEPVKNDPRASS